VLLPLTASGGLTASGATKLSTATVDNGLTVSGGITVTGGEVVFGGLAVSGGLTGTGAAVTLAANLCTSGTVAPGSNNLAGSINGIPGAFCTINFSPAYGTAPFCIATFTDTTGGVGSSIEITTTSTLLTVTMGGVPAGVTTHGFDYVCIGR